MIILFGYVATRTNRKAYVFILIGLATIYSLRGNLPNLHYGYTLFGKPADATRLIFVFFVGAAFYIWRDRIAFTHGGALLAATSLVALLFVPLLAEPAFVILGGFLIFWYAIGYPANCVSRGMDRIDPSYGLYLYAWPVQNLLIFNISDISPFTVTAITLPVATTLGLLSWRFIEKPTLRHKHVSAECEREPTVGFITERRPAP
ncbi:acyltransferase family protein [Methylobacterium sp. NEAU K]|uniref:acyltransferase family protein n=1 Tax=Methylobacterium sp. NEAU K TaxID=3064946 RepID=UPI00351E9601